MSLRPIILCFVAYYLPGYRSGGPVRTIANLVDHLGDEFDIRIVTLDRDVLDTKPYLGVQVNAWNSVGKAQVFYVSNQSITLREIAHLLRETPHDLLYLNSFFAIGFTILPLLARRLGMAPRNPCVIAPRGEFSSGAIAIKKTKKLIHLSLSRLLKLYEGLHWQASSALEANDMRCWLSDLILQIHIASDLPPLIAVRVPSESDSPTKKSGPLHAVFLSRISPVKNLDYLLRALHGVSAPIHLSIYGPIEDSRYWALCRSLIDAMPLHIFVDYLGEVLPSNVSSVLAVADLFVLPTRGENFGHVILEALSVGTPVLISDQTPWRGDGNGGVEELPLDDMVAWQVRLNTWAKFNEATLLARRDAAMSAAQNFLGDPGLIESTRVLFQQALQ